MKAKPVFYAAIISVLVPCMMASSQGYRTIRDVDFENYTYRYTDQEFRVEDGRYESSDDEMPAESLDVISIKFGPLLRTAQEDVAVLTRYNGGGTGFFDAIHIFKLRNGQPVLVDVLEGGDRAHGGIKTLYIENGSLYVVSYDGEQNACATCLDYEYTAEYKWNGKDLALVWKSEPRPIPESEKQFSPIDIDNDDAEESLGGETFLDAEAGPEDNRWTDDRLAGPGLDPTANVNITELLALFTNPQSNVRNQGLLILREIRDPQYLELILSSLKDSSLLVKSTAILTLSELGDARAVLPLIQALDDPSWETRIDVLWALGELRDFKAVDPIIQVYREAITENQRRAGDEAIEALGKIKAQQSIPVLLAALENPDADRRAVAARALGEIGDIAIIPALQAILKAETRSYVRSDITSALQKIALN